MNWFNRLLGGKTEEEVKGEVDEEPHVKKARRQLLRASLILRDAGYGDPRSELEQVEAAARGRRHHP